MEIVDEHDGEGADSVFGEVVAALVEALLKQTERAVKWEERARERGWNGADDD